MQVALRQPAAHVSTRAQVIVKRRLRPRLRAWIVCGAIAVGTVLLIAHIWIQGLTMQANLERIQLEAELSRSQLDKQILQAQIASIDSPTIASAWATAFGMRSAPDTSRVILRQMPASSVVVNVRAD